MSLALIVKSLANIALMLVIVSGIVLVFYTTRLRGTLQHIAPYGKMSLTDYLTQSVVGSCLFYGWGFALYQYLGITYSFLVGLVLLALQYSFAVWWFKSHRYGPALYLWKRATWIGTAQKKGAEAPTR